MWCQLALQVLCDRGGVLVRESLARAAHTGPQWQVTT